MSENVQAAEIHLDIAADAVEADDATGNATIALAFATLAVVDALRDAVTVLDDILRRLQVMGE